VIIGPTPTSVGAAVVCATVAEMTSAGVGTIAPVMAAIVAATADSTVAAISVGDVAGVAGDWAQLAARVRTTARQRARKARMINKILSPDPHSLIYLD